MRSFRDHGKDHGSSQGGAHLRILRSRGPFLKLNPGGPLSGVVTITALSVRGAHLIVEAYWKTVHGERQTAAAEIEGYNAARVLAHE